MHQNAREMLHEDLTHRVTLLPFPDPVGLASLEHSAAGREASTAFLRTVSDVISDLRRVALTDTNTIQKLQATIILRAALLDFNRVFASPSSDL